MDKHAVALVLDDIATLLESSGESQFKARAFRTAARSVEKAEGDLRALIASGALRDLRGIGPATARVIEELVVTGESPYHAALRERAPSGMRELLHVQGLGPKKIAQLFTELGISDLDALEEAARAGRIAAVRGFGERTQQRILEGIAFARGLGGRRRYHQAEEAALRLAGFFEALPAVERAVIAGDLRRGLEIVDGVVIVLGVTGSRAQLARAIRGAAGLTWEDARGDDVIRGRFGDGLTIEVHLTTPALLPVALLYATGPASHLKALERHAAAANVTLSTDGIFRDGADVHVEHEKDVYALLGLQPVPPELRGDGAEVERAARGTLPELVTLKDLRGTFHCHTTHSDGTATVAEMAQGALDLGWRYLGIADHSQNAGYAGGLSPAQLRRQRREVDAWNRRRGDELWLFQGVEADILQDGQVDYAASDPGVLESLDYVVGSVHSQFRMERALMTRRMVRAVRDPRLTMLGHATGRLLLTREGYDVDLDAVIDAAAGAGALIEINADPHRLDMSWQHWPRARERGVRTSINPDAHSVRGMRNVRYGVMIARRAELTPAHVLNTWALEDVQEYFTARRRRSAETS
ncbi:MAG TPA: helix-hairpin-helix domain-containing protein [Longimicrobiales bacterium]|nr:helix-hairpin-helix domain-containing protein [Longimicrobiales bacterium]